MCPMYLQFTNKGSSGCSKRCFILFLSLFCFQQTWTLVVKSFFVLSWIESSIISLIILPSFNFSSVCRKNSWQKAYFVIYDIVLLTWGAALWDSGKEKSIAQSEIFLKTGIISFSFPCNKGFTTAVRWTINFLIGLARYRLKFRYLTSGKSQLYIIKNKLQWTCQLAIRYKGDKHHSFILFWIKQDTYRQVTFDVFWKQD